jgi:hypothetical protein
MLLPDIDNEVSFLKKVTELDKLITPMICLEIVVIAGGG